MPEKHIHLRVYEYLFLLMGLSFPFHLKASVICIFFLFVNWILEGDFKAKFEALKAERLFYLSATLVLIYGIAIFNTSNVVSGLDAIQRKTALIVIPLLVFSRKELMLSIKEIFFKGLTVSSCIAIVICFSAAVYKYSIDGDNAHFFYHSFSQAIDISAIYLSLLCVLSILYLQFYYKTEIKSLRYLRIGLLILLWMGVILLSSKIQLAILLLISLIYYSKKFYSASKLSLGIIILVIAIISVLVYTDNPVSNRFKEIKLANINLLKEKEFTPITEFDGLSLRLVLIRFGIEILNEENAWLLGVSPGDSKTLLNAKIVKANMYLGKPGTADEGFLNYNYHNQYMETLVATGIIGLLSLLLLLCCLIYEAYKNRNWILGIYLVFYLISFLTESILERQIGVVSFAIVFSLFSLVGNNSGRKIKMV